MIKKEWFSPGEIRFNREQVIFLLENSRLLESGYYPPNPAETGYNELKVLVRRGKPRAYFEVPVGLIGEVKARLSRAGIDGEMIWDKYRYDLTEDQLSAYYVLSYEEVIAGLNSAMWFIVGWRREKQSYEDWVARYQYKRRIKRGRR